MSRPDPDPPTTFSAAEGWFKEFLVAQGYPGRVCWLTPTSVVLNRRGRIWVHDYGAQAHQYAERRYVEGLARNLGIALSAVCITDTETFASIYIPEDNIDAQNRLIGRCLKLSCPVMRRPASIVNSRIKWFVLWRCLGHHSNMLEL